MDEIKLKKDEKTQKRWEKLKKPLVPINIGIFVYIHSPVSNSELKTLLHNAEEYTSKLKHQNATGVDTIFMKSLLKFIFLESYDPGKKLSKKINTKLYIESEIDSEIDSLLNAIFIDFQVLPDFIRMISSLDDQNRLRYAGGFFALNRQSQFSASSLVWGLKEAERLVKEQLTISLRLKFLKIYELVLITMFCILEMSKLKTLSNKSFSKRLTELLYSVANKMKYMIGVLKLGKTTRDLLDFIHHFYPAYVKEYQRMGSVLLDVVSS